MATPSGINISNTAVIIQEGASSITSTSPTFKTGRVVQIGTLVYDVSVGDDVLYDITNAVNFTQGSDAFIVLDQTDIKASTIPA